MKNLFDMRDATRELRILRSRSAYKSPFQVVGTYRLIDDGLRPEATVIIKTDRRKMHEASTGVGPVDALANVLKKSLSSIFPGIDTVKLVDFSSGIRDSKSDTSAKVEVTIVFTNGNEVWSVVAISENINKASFFALLDGFEYAVLLDKKLTDSLHAG